MSNYYDDILAQILGSGMFGSTQQASARNMASESEDAAFRARTGSRRKRRRGEPEGAYSLANHPGLQSAMDWASTGNTPGGSAHIGMWLQEQGDPRLQYENMRRRKEWAARQRELLGGWGR